MSTDKIPEASAQPVEPAADRTAPPASLNIVYATIGLVSLIADSLPGLFERSTQRGNRLVQEARTQSRSRRAARRPRPVRTASPQAPDRWQSQIDRLGLPSRQDIEAVTRQVEELERQIDEIVAQQAEAQRGRAKPSD